MKPKVHCRVQNSSPLIL